MNAGPGAPGGLYINKKHYKNTFEGPRFEGWWGNKRASRFLMRDNFEPEKGASAWQLSTASPIMLSAMQASLEIFDEIGMKKLRERSKKLTGYLRSIIPENFEIITPENSASQLSLRVKAGDKKLFDYLMKNNVFSDWREPDVIRVAPIASYTQFEELDAFVNLLKKYA
jgi:kynureninase